MTTNNITLGGVTDAGLGREENQDSCFFDYCAAASFPLAILAVADGVGGLSHGAWASSSALAHVRTWWAETTAQNTSPNSGALLESLCQCATRANTTLWETANHQGYQMGTTLSVLLLGPTQYALLHVGDSRIYQLPKGFAPLTQLTQDHTTLLPKASNGGTVYKRVLTQCLGYRPTLTFQQAVGQAQPGQMYMACTDGIYKTLPDKTIGKILRRHKAQPEAACKALVTAAKNNQETDNLTALAAKTSKGA